MKFIVVDQREDGDIFTSEFNTAAEAIEDAKFQWARMAPSEREQSTFYVLESSNPDPDAEDHLDGTPIWEPER